MARKKIFEIPRLFFTDKHCHFGGFSRPGIGILIDEYAQPVYEVIDWLVAQRKKKSKTDDFGTVKMAAWAMRMFWEFLSRCNKDWRTEVNDNFLLKWRDMMLNGKRVSAVQKALSGRGKDDVAPLKASTVNQRLSSVVAFYLSCKWKGHVAEHLIGYGGSFMINVEPDGKGRYHWIHLEPEREASSRDIPTPEDIDGLVEQIDETFGSEAAYRNKLYVSWGEQVGLRSIEAASLKVDMIPDADVIEEHIQKERAYPMEFSPRKQGVRTKRNKPRAKPLNVDPMLLRMTRDYIDMYRPEIVARAQTCWGRSYKEPREIFLSITGDTMGQAINPKTMQNAINKALKDAGSRARGHGLRAYFAMSTVESLFLGRLMAYEEAGIDIYKANLAIMDNDIITYASQLLGHKYPTTTLKHYLDLTRVRLLEMSPEMRIAYMDRRKRDAVLAVRQAGMKLDDLKSQHAVAKKFLEAERDIRKAVDKGDKDKLFQIVRNILDGK